MQTVRNYLVHEYVPVMVKTFRSDIRESCVAQRSINFMLRGNEEARHFINKVRNVLRRLSDRIYERILILGTKFQIYFCFTFFDALSKTVKFRTI